MRFFKFSLIILLFTNLIFSCKKRGCTDPDALNFSDKARKDDHSCYYFWIGQHYGGGDVFYIDQTKKHGLIVAKQDIGFVKWGCDGTNISEAASKDVYSGARNTQNIVDNCDGVTAASLCNDLDTLGYDDWFLPSLEELKGLSSTLGKLGQAGLKGYIWSSTQSDANNAYAVSFSNNAVVTFGKSAKYVVRPIRAF